MEQKLYLQYLSRKRHFYKIKLSDLYIADLAQRPFASRPPYLYHHQYTLARACAFVKCMRRFHPFSIIIIFFV